MILDLVRIWRSSSSWPAAARRLTFEGEDRITKKQQAKPKTFP